MHTGRRVDAAHSFGRFALLVIVLALAACAAHPPGTGAAPPGRYFVQPGDNIHSIAFALETTPRALLRANPWAEGAKLTPGMRLAVPPESVPGPGAPQGGGSGSGTGSQGVADGRSHYIWPLESYDVSSRYGRRWGRFHRGIDLQAPRGTAVLAVAEGRIKYSGRSGAFGNMVVVDHGGGIETVYAHNLRNLVVRGERVAQGQVIARVGRTGNASGYHLHFEFRRNGRALNPVSQIRVAQE